MIKLLSVAIVAGLFFESNQSILVVPPDEYGCWTGWFDRDDPSLTGDWETLPELRKANPGKICSKPVNIQVRTLSGLTVAAAGDVAFKSDTTSGFACRNQDQPKNKKCNDYRVRFSCPPSFCDVGEELSPGCWTDWFDRDDPSLTGDWETLPELRKANPGKICSKPVNIQVRTLSGLTVAAAGDVAFKSDTTSGFACRNQDQTKNKMCNDYRVRFRCPPSFCDVGGCWTGWFDRDDPSLTGDWETLPELRKANPGKICSKPVNIQVRTLSGLTVAAAGDVAFKSDTTSGFACRNQDQPKNKKCNDYRVRFSCPPSFCDVGEELSPGCWTDWFDRDDPSLTGDWETLPELRKANPGKICSKPVNIQVRTLSGLTVAAAGDVAFKSDTTSGFACRNQDQTKNKMCNDYRVRFRCPPSFCDVGGCWTGWFDRDDPSLTGDWETLPELRKANPGKICSKPVNIQVRTLSGLTVAAAGDVAFKSDTTSGFACRNQDQPKNKKCNDYRVRFSCPPSFCDVGEELSPGCWTGWFDRDDPSLTGDWETLPELRKANPGKICSKPVNIQVRTLSGLTVAAAGDVAFKSDTTSGFACRNQDQTKNKMCNDYRVRFRCPPSFCDVGGCWTGWFDRDDPSLTGDWETLPELRKANPGKICSKPVNIQVRTLSGLTVAAAGDVAFKSDTTSGFACRNQDQPKNKKCNDYRVRFSCPPSFCDVGEELSPGCWTGWFDRDDPSLTGDWETLPELRKANPGKICSKPVNIQVRTLSGLTVAAAGDVAFKSDTTSGFACRNQDQTKNKMCNDYRVRFRCPPSFCDVGGCWTGWFDRDDPSLTGDWETLPELRKKNPGKICSKPLNIQVRTLSGLTVAAAGDVAFKSDTTSGFACRNQDQPKNKKCNDYRVRFSCPPSFCDVGEELSPGCWTDWFDRDDPSLTGDWETLPELRKANPGKICSKPVNIQVRTLSGLTVAAAGDVAFKSDTTSGFACRNQDQTKNKMCNDYRVRFRCPPSFCDVGGCWTGWFDRDDPSLTGDWETLPELRKANPGKICSKPVNIQVRTLSGLTVAAAGDVAFKSDTTSGFACRNQDQPKNKKCNDYRVRFSCPPSFCDVGEELSPGCWTDWFDRDDPSLTGDWETLPELRKANPGKICSKPVNIQVRTLSGLTVAAAGDVAFKSDTTSGFACRNQDQTKNKMCNDYRVRFRCPPSFCDVGGCWTGWFDRDDPSLTGDWETLPELRKKNPGKICSKPVNIQVRTLSGLTVAAAGDVAFKSDTTSGFACRNQDQPKNKKCNDYRVRFSCPPSFCDVGEELSPGCWTDWFDRDDPSLTGDWETLPELRKANPGKICSKPVNIQVRTLSGLTVAAAGDVAFKSDTTSGFVCRNQDQPKNKMCNDYHVRFRCPPCFCEVEVCWTKWYDRDDPCGIGDFELLSNLMTENPGEICDKPLQIEAVTTDTLTPANSTGETFFIYSPSKGFVCRKMDQKSGMCHDYKVRFGCPCII